MSGMENLQTERENRYEKLVNVYCVDKYKHVSKFIVILMGYIEPAVNANKDQIELKFNLITDTELYPGINVIKSITDRIDIYSAAFKILDRCGYHVVINPNNSTLQITL